MEQLKEKTGNEKRGGMQKGDWQRFVEVQRERFGLVKGKKQPLKFYLKLCAHCKGKAETVSTAKLQYVRCTECGASVSAATMAEAVNKWNMREGKVDVKHTAK